MKTLHVSLMSFGFMILLLSCKKTEGPAGPPGEPGPAGPQGSTGTANVIYSNWVTATKFADSTIDGSKLKIAHVAAKDITTEILNSASISVYFNFGGGAFVLPYTSYAGSKANTVTFFPKVGDIVIGRFTHDNTASVVLSTALQYRYIIIPGGVKTNGRSFLPYDLNDYASVCKYFNIPE